MQKDFIATGSRIGLRKIDPGDFEAIAEHPYSVSVLDPHAEVAAVERLFARSSFWTDEAAAVAMVEVETERMIGTLQCYRSAPCIHGLEIGYVFHDEADRGHGYAAEALRLFSDQLFSSGEVFYRQQLIIEVWNTPSWKTAERAGFVREGVLRSCGFGDGDPSDGFVYSRTRKDVRQQSASSNGAG